MRFFSENAPIMHIARRLGMAIVSGAGDSEAFLDLNARAVVDGGVTRNDVTRAPTGPGAKGTSRARGSGILPVGRAAHNAG